MSHDIVLVDKTNEKFNSDSCLGSGAIWYMPHKKRSKLSKPVKKTSSITNEHKTKSQCDKRPFTLFKKTMKK